MFAISFATLVYDGPDAPAGAIAAGACFVLFGGAATAVVVAARSGLPAIAEVQDGPSAIFAVMAAAIYSTEGIDETAKLPTLEAAIVLTTVSTGVLMNLLGKYKLGNIVRLLPSPVTGGFLAGTGYVLTAGAFKVLSGGNAMTIENALRFIGISLDGSPANVGWFEQLAFVGVPGIVLGLALAVGNRRIGKFWVVPAFLGGGVSAYFAALEFFLRVTPEDALTRGYLLGPFPEMNPTRRFGFFLDSSLGSTTQTGPPAGLFGTSFDPLLTHPDVLLNKVRWDVVLDQAPGAVAVFGLSTLGVLLITSAVEMSTERDGDANDELRAAGAANVVSGLGGGFVGYHSLSSTQIAYGMGSASRVPGITCALAYVGALYVGPAPLAYVPSFLIGGLLLFIGSSFLYEWVVEGKDRLPKSEYAVVLLIVVTVASQGYIAGVAAGVLGAAAVFVRDYSKVPVVRSRLRLGQRGGVRSSAPRVRREVDVIARRGAATYGAKLQGFLFFATAYKVSEEIRAAHDASVEAYEEKITQTRLSSIKKPNAETFLNEFSDFSDLRRTPRGLSHVVLDFASVVGVDGSAIAVFEKLERWARRENVVLVLSDCARPELSRVVDIALAGEAQPTFAFVDRPRAGKDSLLAPNLRGLREAVGDGLVASDALGIVVQTTDLDAALRFTEQSLLFAESDFVARFFSGNEDEETRRANGSASIGDWTERDDGFFRSDENASHEEEAFEDAFVTFDAVCESVCETRDEERAFREAWTPVVFEADAVVCERGEVADRIYWIESAVVVVETGGRVTEDTEDTGASDADENERASQRSGDVSDSVDEYDDEVPEPFFATKTPAAEKDDEESPAPRAAAAAAAVTAAAAAVADLRDRLVGTGSSDETEVASSSSSGDDFPKETEEFTEAPTVAEMANAERASYGISVTRDFMGAVGFYRRGGVGKVRFGRIVVREPGDGYCLSADALELLEESHPRLAVRLHKLLAGTLANQVVSRNKLITQFIK